MKEEIAILTQRLRDLSAENYNLKKELAVNYERTALTEGETKKNGEDMYWIPINSTDIHQELLATRWKNHELEIENNVYRSKLQNYEEEFQKHQVNFDENDQTRKTLSDESEQGCSASAATTETPAAAETEAAEIREAYARLALQRDGLEEEIESRYRTRLNRLEEQINTLKRQNDRLRSQNSKLQENNEALRADRDAAKRQREESREEIRELTANQGKPRRLRPVSWIPSLPKRTHRNPSGEDLSKQDTRDKQPAGQKGVSIVVRAGSNKQAAQKFLQQLVKLNTFKPTEVILLFDQAQANHLQLEKDFARKLSLRILSGKGRTFASLVPQLYYDQTLILTLPLEWDADLLPKAAEQLQESGASHLALKAPDQALLVKTEAMTCFAERFLMAPANVLHESLAKKTKG